MIPKLDINRLSLVLLCAGQVFSAAVAPREDLRIPDASEYNYTREHPFQIPAKPNGLDVKTPNLILFNPDQLRFDSVGCFGNDVRGL